MEMCVQRLRQLGGSLTSAPSPHSCHMCSVDTVTDTPLPGKHVVDNMQFTLTHSCCLLKQSW